MMSTTPPIPSALPWSARLTLSAAPPPTSLTGDKILLPQLALEQLLAAASRVAAAAPTTDPHDPWARPPTPSTDALLPHPLIVKLTHTGTGVSAFAVPQEFSADEGGVVVSAFLRRALGVEDEDKEVDVEVDAASIPKGTRVRLRPLEAGYDDEDWKPILERYMRERFATVAEGMVLEVPGRGKHVWRFLVDQALPGGVVCVVDTDLEVDIEPLDEEQARETLRRRLQKKSSGGKLKLEQTVQGDVAAGGEHFYELDTWDRARPLEIELDGIDLEEGEDVDLFVTTDHQHHKPRLEQHVWGYMGSVFPKRIQISPGNIELVDAKSVHIGIRGWKEPSDDDEAVADTRRYTLFITQDSISAAENDPSASAEEAPSPEHKRCKNCTQWIPSRTFFLHENFCLRNNVHCSLCNTVFKRGTEQEHWHCPDCSAHGNAPASRRKHVATTHTPRACGNCNAYTASSLPDLAAHTTSTCPAKLILCGFCHLLVPQDGSHTPSADQILSGLSAHEIQCGARTTECTLCSRRTRLRDMPVHLRNHELTRLSRPVPSICKNPLCPRAPGANALGLCDICFGPLYTAAHDPTGSGLRARLERRLLRQMLAGCGRMWCRSRLCKSARGNMGLPRVMGSGVLPMVRDRQDAMLPLCVDEATARRRDLAEALQAESGIDGRGAFALGFCCRAVEAANGDVDGARRWLEREGVRSGER